MPVRMRTALAGLVLIVLGAGAWFLLPRSGSVVVTPDIVRQNNRAVGLMGQFDFEAAVSEFDALATAEPDWPWARLNLAVALVNRQGPDDAARAEALLRELLDVEPVARRARYTLGLLLTHEGRDDEALPLLTEVADGEPPDGFAAYFAGQLRLSSTPAEALEYYQRAAEREPLLRSAFYGAFLALRRLQREDDAARMLEQFQTLERHPQALVAEFKYTRMGPLSEAVTVDVPGRESVEGPSGARFLGPQPLVSRSAPWRPGGRPRSITLADIDGDGSVDVFIAAALTGPAANAVLLARGDTFELQTTHPLAQVPDVHAALWGDLDDDGRVDVVLCRPSGGTQVWLHEDQAWRDVSTTMGVSVSLPGTDIVDGAVFDADHDGDLDIWLVNAAGPNELLNNDGNGRFRAIGGPASVAGDGSPSRGIAVADLDGDRDADVIVLKREPPHDVFINDLVWEYRRDESARDLVTAPVSAVIAGDFDADGALELYTAGERGLERWRRDGGRAWRAERVSATTDADAQVALADTNGDGRLEVLASSGGSWASFEAATAASGWTQAAGGEAADSPGGWVVAELDARSGPSVIGIGADGVPRIWMPGPGRRRFLGLAFTGRDPASDQRRSNVSGLGTRVAVRVDSRWTAFETTRLASGPGQSLQPFTVGVGEDQRADFIAVTWSDGVFQTELALESGELHRIAETQRQLSSCPVLFAWDGTGFRFVTDMLGAGGLGFFERPGVYSKVLPREHVLLPSGALVPTDGQYRVKIAEPMEEITYLDALSLVAYDLPPGWRMALDERKAVNGPVPSGQPIFYRTERLPSRATRGADDVTEALAEADLDAVGATTVDPRFIGRTEPWSVTMSFDVPIDRGPGTPVLLIDGWVEYPYAQTIFAAWQAGAAYEAPTLDAQDATGHWHEVAREFGYPAGMPRRMAFPLPPLPAGTRALRLRTSQEIYWDRVAIAYAEPSPDVRRRVLPLRAATLEPDGFARRSTGPQRTPHYDDERRAPLGDTRHPRGWYTEFGRVDPLVAAADDAVAIFGPGESLSASFEASDEPLPEGWTRHLVLQARGWCKDMDLYTLDGDTVEPLPGRATAARDELHSRYNTRYAAGY